MEQIQAQVAAARHNAAAMAMTQAAFYTRQKSQEISNSITRSNRPTVIRSNSVPVKRKDPQLVDKPKGLTVLDSKKQQESRPSSAPIPEGKKAVTTNQSRKT